MTLIYILNIYINKLNLTIFVQHYGPWVVLIHYYKKYIDFIKLKLFEDSQCEDSFNYSIPFHNNSKEFDKINGIDTSIE